MKKLLTAVAAAAALALAAPGALLGFTGHVQVSVPTQAYTDSSPSGPGYVCC
jgi:hypothetical protein